MVFLQITLEREWRDDSNTRPNWGLRLDTKGQQWMSVAPTADSIAGKAGIQAGDIIHSINGIAIFMRTMRQSGRLAGKQVNPMIDTFLRTHKTIVLDIERDGGSSEKAPQTQISQKTQSESETQTPAVHSAGNTKKNSPMSTKKPRLSHHQPAPAAESPRAKEERSLAETRAPHTSVRGARHSTEAPARAEKSIAPEKMRMRTKDSYAQQKEYEKPSVQNRIETHTATTSTGKIVAPTPAPPSVAVPSRESGGRREITAQLPDKEKNRDTKEVPWVSSFGPFDAEEVSLRRKLFAIAHSRHRQECRRRKENDKEIIKTAFGDTANCSWYQYLRINSII